MFDLVEAAKTIINFCEEGDLMSALAFFEGEVRPEITEIETHEHAEILACMKTALLAIDDEDWNVALETVDKMSALLNG